MKIEQILSKFVKNVSLINESDEYSNNNNNIINKVEPTPSGADNINISYKPSDLRKRIKEEGKEKIIDEMYFILNEITKDIDNIDINKLAKSFLTLHNMDYKMKYIMSFLSNRGIKTNSATYKHIMSLFYDESIRELMDSILTVLNPDANFKKVESDARLNLINYEFCYKDNEIVRVDNFFERASQEGPFSAEQLLGLYSLPSLRNNNTTGNAELMFILTGQNCKFGGTEDITIGPGTKIKIKAPLGQNKSSVSRLYNEFFKNGTAVVTYVADAVNDLFKKFIKKYKINVVNSFAKRIIDNSSVTYSLDLNYNGKGIILFSALSEFWKLMREQHIENPKLSNILIDYRDEVRKLLVDIFKNAWTNIPNKEAEHFIIANYEGNFEQPEGILRNYDEVIDNIGVTFLMMYAAKTKNIEKIQGKNNYTHIGIFNGALDEHAALITIPLSNNTEYFRESGISFIIPETTGAAGRKALWGIKAN